MEIDPSSANSSDTEYNVVTNDDIKSFVGMILFLSHYEYD